MSIKVKSSTKSENTSCPYCKGDLKESESLKTCEACQTSLHEECAKEMGRCTTVGCEKPFSFPGAKVVRIKETRNTSLAAATTIEEEEQEPRVSRLGFKFSIILTVTSAIFFTIMIGELIAPLNQPDDLIPFLI
ncbi:MAG: RING finger protein, partial [Planctomycetota bacterium]|nr:RING finger protein [Planctomycetota bacterium]